MRKCAFVFVLCAGVLFSEISMGVENWFEDGVSFLKQGRYDEAIKAFSVNIEIIPDDAEAYHNRGVAWFYKKEYDSAVSDYTKALEIHPNYAEAYHSRAGAWFYKGEYDKAISDCNQFLKMRPEDFEAYNNRGMAWFRKGEYNKAIADHARALELNPDYAEAHQRMAWILSVCPDPEYRSGETALIMAKKAIELRPDRHFWDTLAAAHAETGDVELAADIQKNLIVALNAEGSEIPPEYFTRMKRYESGQPWREQPAIPPDDIENQSDVYTLHILSYLNQKEITERAAIKLKNRGIPVFISREGNWYYIYAGLYETEEDARKAAENLKAEGFQPKVVIRQP
jgi:tetratricopeptide (TPR) repeat protein